VERSLAGLAESRQVRLLAGRDRDRVGGRPSKLVAIVPERDERRGPAHMKEEARERPLESIRPPGLRPPRPSDVEAPRVQRVLLDEAPPGLDLVTHERLED